MRSVFLLLLGAFASALPCFAQISPTPVINNEIKDDSSIRMRSIQLERVKRDAEKPTTPQSEIELQAKFAQIKEDFEAIQKLENSIVKVYMTGEKIDYARIRELSLEIKKKAIRFRLNFFNSPPEIESESTKQKSSKKGLKDLIIDLDRTIGKFVGSPVFKSSEIIDSKMFEKTQLDLVKIIFLSDSLSKI